MGDIDLSGHEKLPTLDEKIEKYQTECGHLKNSIQSIPDWPIINCHDDMKCALQLITTKIHDMREIENVERKRLVNWPSCFKQNNNSGVICKGLVVINGKFTQITYFTIGKGTIRKITMVIQNTNNNCRVNSINTSKLSLVSQTTLIISHQFFVLYWS